MKQLMRNKSRRGTAHRQDGVVLYVALVVMVVMMLAGVAVLRSVGTGQGVAGNLSFKQNATSGGDRGVNAALGYLRPAIAASAPTTAQLAVDHPGQGYFSTWGPATPAGAQPAPFNPFTFDWDNDPTVVVATANDGTGNRVRYVIHRLCNPDPPNECVAVMDGQTLGTAGGGASATSIAPPPPPPYFRVTTRIDGPRNTVSYTQVVMK
jgi:hypothetical protein